MIRRPLMFICSFFIAGIIAGHYFRPVLWISAYLAIFIFLALISVKHKKIIISMVVIGLLGSVHITFASGKLDMSQGKDNDLISIKGRVTAQDTRRDTAVLTVKTGEGRSFIVYVKGGQNAEYLGDMVNIKGKLQLPSKRRNPGLFDYNLYLKTKGIAAGISAFETNVKQENRFNPLIRIPGKVKDKIIRTQEKYMAHDKSALLNGVLFGDKRYIEEDIYDTFQKNGTAHILAVSGIHVSIIYAYVSGLFRGRRNRKGSVLTVLFLLFYCALAEFSPSVVRAVSVIVIHIAGKFLHRRFDLSCAVACSAMLMLFYNPYCIFNAGFQMSYVAVLSLSFVMPHFSGGKNYLTSSVIPLISVQIAMAPMMAFHFMFFSFSAFIINIPVIFLAGLVVPLGVSLAALSLMPDSFFLDLLLNIGYGGLQKALDLIVWLNRVPTENGISHMNVVAPSLTFMALFYGLFFFLLSESFLILIQQKRKGAVEVIGLILLSMAVLLPLAIDDGPGKADLVFLDVGQGDCLHIRTTEGKNILIDGGGQRDFDVGEKILRPYLLKNGVKKIDLALVTHLHHDHYGGIASLCRELPVLKLGVYEGNMLKLEGLKTDTGLNDDQFLFLGAGDTIYLDDNTSVEVLYPGRHSMAEYEKLMGWDEDENLNSLVFMVTHKNMKILITGDMTESGERQVMDMCSNLKTDILKIGHHGSRFSTGNDFLAAASPLMAVIQVGSNNYGHPHSEIIEKLEKKSIIVYRNDLHGAVLVNIKNERLKVRTML